MNDCLLAYLAGAVDSDGWMGIKGSTYHLRVRKDARHTVYIERMGLKQVTPEVPTLLHEQFGGRLALERPTAKRGRPLYSWHVSDRQAANAARALLPYLRIKRRQAETILALRATKDLPFKERRVRRSEPTVSRNRWGMAAAFRWELAPAILEERERLAQLMHELNRVGV